MQINKSVFKILENNKCTIIIIEIKIHKYRMYYKLNLNSNFSTRKSSGN